MSDLDLVVVGATGFTGRQAAAYLAAHAPPELRWALVGRNEARLLAVRDGLGPAQAGRECLVVDTQDEAAVEALVARTRVVLTTVGPYAQYGEPLLAACARQGRHYVDITGETPWVARMIERHHATALESGARIVPFCGFDSVPSDLGAWMLAEHQRQRGGAALAEVLALFRARGGFNGGTLASALGMMERGDGRTVARPDLLNAPGPIGTYPRDQRGAVYVAEASTWSAPFFMEAVNTRVVRRTASLLAGGPEDPGPAFRYREAMRTGPGLSGNLLAQTLTLSLGAFAVLMSGAWGRGLVRRLAPAPGEGPDEQTMDRGFFRVDLLARTVDGGSLRGRIEGQGDPGNRCTVRMLCEAALCLCLDEAALPPRAGILTPATALAGPYLARLRAAGMRFEVSG